MPAKRTGPERFSDRVENYVRYRPDYPPGVVEILERAIGLTPSWTIADIGSGAGLSSQLFLENGNKVYGVEPNLQMRLAAEHYLKGYDGFHSVAGSAEATTLLPHSMHCVVAAQAFHWFDGAAARAEAQRILRPEGWAVLLWNKRRLSGTPFLEAYEQLLTQFGTDYQEVRHDNVDHERLTAYFGGDYWQDSVANQQRFDLDGLLGRIASSSYVPAPDDPRYAELIEAATRIFSDHQTADRVVLEYDCEIYWGPVE